VKETQSQKETQSHPTLDEDQAELLTYLIDNPDSPVSVVYREVGIRPAKITRIRDELTVQGFLQELEVRTGSTTGGRLVKFLIPTLKAWEQLAIDPPKGRGGAIHRHVQRMVVNGALAKGYGAVVEHAVGTGIVDVHLQKGAAVQIAVEIAVISTPEREINHIRNCLSVGLCRS
jgi:DNA-binding Lrp family transcriptional regulator